MIKHKYDKTETKNAIFLLAPSILLLIFIAFYPLFSVFRMSFTDRVFAGSKKPNIVWLDNYKKLLTVKVFKVPENKYAIEVLPTEPIRFKELKEFSLGKSKYVLAATDPDFIRAIFDTVVFTVCSVSIETILGLIIAIILNNHFRGRGVMRMAMLLPWAIPTAISSRIWEWMFSPSRVGIINTFASYLGFTDGQFPFLLNTKTQLFSIVAIDVWKTTPFMALIILAGLQIIPASIYEAASIDGASAWKKFTKITLKLLRPTLAIAIIFRTLDAMRVFDLFQIIFGNKRYSMASFTYFQLIQNKAMGYSSASSIIIFIILFCFAIAYLNISKGLEHND